jgi:hypothetical protein
VGPRPLAPQRRHREHRGFPPHHALQKALAAEDHLQLLPHHGLRLVFGYSRLSAPTSSVCLSRASAFFFVRLSVSVGCYVPGHITGR